MLEEKLQCLKDEFYKLKAEITSGEISLKRNYLLFKKYMLMLTLYERIEADLKKADKEKSKEAKYYALLASIILLPLIIYSPLTLLILIYQISVLKKSRDREKKELQDSLTFAGVVDNIGEIIYPRVINGFQKLNGEQNAMLEYEAHIEPAQTLLTSEIYNMLKEIYNIDATNIGDVENQVLYGKSR